MVSQQFALIAICVDEICHNDTGTRFILFLVLMYISRCNMCNSQSAYIILWGTMKNFHTATFQPLKSKIQIFEYDRTNS